MPYTTGKYAITKDPKVFKATTLPAVFGIFRYFDTH